jgi:hypothetical protein
VKVTIELPETSLNATLRLEGDKGEYLRCLTDEEEYMPQQLDKTHWIGWMSALQF